MSCTPSAAGTDVHATLPEETQRLLASAATVDAASLSELTEEGLLSSALSKPGWRSEAALPVHVRSFGCVEANGFVYILGGFCLENGRACAKVWRCRAESLVLLGDVMHVYEGQPAEVWPSEHELLQQAAELVSSKFQALLGPGREGGEFVGELRELQLLAQRVADNSVRAAGEFVREFVRDQAPGQGGSDGGGEGSGLGVGEGGVGGVDKVQGVACVWWVGCVGPFLACSIRLNRRPLRRRLSGHARPRPLGPHRLLHGLRLHRGRRGGRLLQVHGSTRCTHAHAQRGEVYTRNIPNTPTVI